MGMRDAAQRKALLQSLGRALFEKKRIETTEGRAKAMRPYIEKIITKIKNQKNPVLAQRELSKLFPQKEVRDNIIKEIAPKYIDRPGGYTRIYKLGQRQSDGARIAIIELI
jgi:large subunit ribosomal protein L17